MYTKCVICLPLFVFAVVASLTLPQADAADVFIPTSQIVKDNDTRYFLISIGVNNFADDFWPSLKWPVSDATRVSDKLGQDTNNRIVKKLLIGESATIDEVYASLNEVAQQASSGDTVVLYISSHGTLAQNADGNLERIVVLQDSKHDQLFSTGLSHKVLQNWLEGLKSRKKMMIFATCHSGEGKSRLPPKVEKLVASNKGKLIALSDVSEGALVLAAAAKGEAARENDDLQGDIYTHYLLEALTIYDRNRDGMVSALEAHDYARDRTWAFTKGQQRPTANIKLIGDDAGTVLTVFRPADGSYAAFTATSVTEPLLATDTWCPGNESGTPKNATFSSLVWDDASQVFFVGTASGKILAIDPSAACTAMDLLPIIDLGDTIPVNHLSVYPSGLVGVIQDSLDKEGSIKYIEFDGAGFILDSLSYNDICEAPLGSMEISGNHIVVMCTYESVLKNPSDTTPAPTQTNIDPRLYITIDSSTGVVINRVNIDGIASAGVVVDPATQTLYRMQEGAFGNLEIINLVTGERRTNVGLYLENILN